ncbi:MAG: TonB-dependent siderophore receptor [Gemmatimonadaceae bacterium]
MRYANLVASLLVVCSGTLVAQDPVASQATVSDHDTVDLRSVKPRELEAVRVEAARSRRSYGASTTRSATRIETPLRDTPQSATVLTRALIADQAMQSMADVVRYIPGVTMGQGEGHRDAPTIRGNSSTADFFVDGVRDDAQYLRDVYNVERVEALKGPNAMVFGRGGGGGVLNRVSKEATWARAGALTLEGGSFDHNRATLDVGDGLGGRAAIRFNGIYEKSDGFRDGFSMKRRGLNPTASVMLGGGTMLKLDYERFVDDRTVDRGIPSAQGVPSAAAITTFFGDRNASYSHTNVDAAGVGLERALGHGVTLRNRSRWVQYDKFYQNVYPDSAVNAAGTGVKIAAYNSATPRTNLFNQTDLVSAFSTGSVRHSLVAGAELSRQVTQNYRQTGYFDNGTVTKKLVPFDQPSVSAGATYRQSATDGDNRVVANVAAVYVQDQVALSPMWQAIVGVRIDRFALRFHDNRKNTDLQRDDQLVSPRAGLVFKPVSEVSLYGSFGVSHLPSAGDQFSSLTATTRSLAPERFRNYEVGAKWDVLPRLMLTSALYRLDRTNSSAPDPLQTGVIVQTGAQRSTGAEFGLTGEVTSAWQIAGGFATQRAEITSTTSAAPAGRSVPLVPRRTLSLWNRYQVTSAAGVGLGVVRQASMFASIDNTVTLPAFTRVDGALFVTATPHVRLQLNVENLFDRRYYATSHGNNNILPGAPRSLKLSVTTGL